MVEPREEGAQNAPKRALEGGVRQTHEQDPSSSRIISRLRFSSFGSVDMSSIKDSRYVSSPDMATVACDIQSPELLFGLSQY